MNAPKTGTAEVVESYYQLTPETVIQAVESLGFLSDARIFALNSYENRVYQVGIDEQAPLIAKFYRPGRWSDAQILEEHGFSQQLQDLELPVIAPLLINNQSLHDFSGYRFALYARMGGQAPEPGDFDQLYRLGQLLGRIHAASNRQPFQYRLALSLENYLQKPAELLLQKFIPAHLSTEYERLLNDLSQLITQQFQTIDNLKLIRTHGDCHIGNILWNRDSGPWFVDFDDCLTAPAVQDLWMLLAGNRHEQVAQLSELLEGYQTFCAFNLAELALIESLRCLRMVHYAGWLAKRWQDPAFPKNFPWFNNEGYWQRFLHELQEQQLVMREPAIQLF